MVPVTLTTPEELTVIPLDVCDGTSEYVSGAVPPVAVKVSEIIGRLNVVIILLEPPPIVIGIFTTIFIARVLVSPTESVRVMVS